MSKGSKATSQPEQRDSKGEHGGNRGGDRQEDEEQPKQSSQAAGKDPHRHAEGDSHGRTRDAQYSRASSRQGAQALQGARYRVD